MEETIHEVVVGSTLADKAGHALVEIEQVSTRLTELMQSISESAKQQATSSEDISNAMSNISKVTELVQTGANRAADSVKMLVELSDELRVSVEPFKLPDDRSVRRSEVFQIPDSKFQISKQEVNSRKPEVKSSNLICEIRNPKSKIE